MGLGRSRYAWEFWLLAVFAFGDGRVFGIPGHGSGDDRCHSLRNPVTPGPKRAIGVSYGTIFD